MNPRVDRPIMDIEAHRDLKLLEAVEADSRVTQRTLATKLGIALGLTNIYLKRLVRKGFIKCVNVRPNRISYATPTHRLQRLAGLRRTLSSRHLEPDARC